MNFFITNKHYHDFSYLTEAEPNSKLIPLTEGKVNIYHNERIKNEMLTKMREANATEKDFIVISGAGILNAIAALAMKEVVGKVNVAIYNSNDRTYKKRFNI